MHDKHGTSTDCVSPRQVEFVFRVIYEKKNLLAQTVLFAQKFYMREPFERPDTLMRVLFCDKFTSLKIGENPHRQ